MMATVPLSSSSLLPLLATLEDNAAGVSEQTDAYLTIASRLSGEDGRQFFPIIVKHFSRLGKAFQTHISSENEELSQAALQALGFCVFNTNIVSGIPANFVEEILLALCALVLKSTDKNTCTRALWVISKQNFPGEVVSKKTPDILKTLEAMQTKDMQSVLTDHESLNVVIKLLEQAPVQMGEGAVCWAKLVIPLVVHTASKVRLRAAAALEMGMPLLLEKQQEVAAVVEPMMSSKLIPEMQKLFSAKNESNVLKLWPLFVKLLGKLLHKGGAFINSLLYLEELGFRSSSPSIKKIAFIAWKSLIDNFALNADILCSSKRLKLLMQPLSSILVRTEALLLTKLEVWWYLVVKLGPNLAANFDQVGVPLLHSTLPADVSLLSTATPVRNTSQSNGVGLTTPKSGVPSCSSPASSSRLSLNASVSSTQSYSSIQLLGLEMLLHYFLGSQASAAAAKNNLQLSLEPLTHNLLSSNSFFSKHASTFISAVQDGFIAVGKDTPEALLNLIWSSLVNHVCTTIEAAGNKKERQGSEVLTLLLQALQSILSSEALPAARALALLETTVKAIPQKVLGSAAYQVANMDVLNGTPALFLIHLFHNNSMLSAFVTDERFFLCLETLVSCGLCGPTSPLAFGEAVLGVIGSSVESVENKEHLWRMWSVVVNPLTDTITQTNEVNQGDALEHNFSAIHSALMFPITHLFTASGLPQMTQKSVLSTWSRLYKAFARCSALVATAEENVCCEELCAKISGVLDGSALKNLSTLDAVANVLQSIIESVDFTPFSPQFQQKMKSPHTPLGWVRKRSKALGNLSSFHLLLVQSLEAFLALLASEDNSGDLSGIGTLLFSIVSAVFTNLALPTVIQESMGCLTKPLSLLYGQAGSSEDELPKSLSMLGSKLEKLVADVLGSLQTRSALQFDDELLVLLCPLLCVLFPHKNKHIRTAVTHFWNATFGNALVLTYPEMLIPVLSQAKQKAPLILPGFQAVENSEDFNGQCSSECSQLDTKISGIKVTSVGKRESMLSRTAEQKEHSSGTTSKPVSVKLDFGSPKPPRKEVLDEEASVDFVFIPPEAKERVLTEHQKEVKRTKRDDIPAMYNNLDASLDTTVFTQYTQSQEESVDKLATNEQDENKEMNESESMDVTSEELSVNDGERVQDEVIPEAVAQEKVADQPNQTAEVAPSADIEMADVSEQGNSLSHKESQSPDVSGSSDVISGTPPKPSSRRQSFITLEKYVEGRTAGSPSINRFTGPLTRTSRSRDSSKSPTDSKSLHASDVQPEAVEEICQETSANATEQPANQVDKNIEIEAELQSISKNSSEGTVDEDEVIPDTQTQDLGGVENENTSLDKPSEEGKSGLASPEVDSEDLTASQASSSSEPRRSGRRRSKPLRPGEDPAKSKNKRQSTSTLTDAQTPTPSTETDNVLPGRDSTGKALEKNVGESTKLPSGEHEESSQVDSQVPSLATNTSLSRGRGRRRRRSKSRELSQTEPSTDNQTPSSQMEDKIESPLSQSDRPVRKTRMSNTALEVLGKRSKNTGSQADSPAVPKKNNKRVSSPNVEATPVSPRRSPGRPKKNRKSGAADLQNMEKAVENEMASVPSQNESQNESLSESQNESQNDSQAESKNDSQNESQADSQTLTPRKRRSCRRKKLEEEMNTSGEPTPSGSVSSKFSQDNETREAEGNSQGRGKYTTRRSSPGLLETAESKTNVSVTKAGRPKNVRRRQSLTSEVTADPLVHENAPDNTVSLKDSDTPSVPTEMPEKEQEASFEVTLIEAKTEDKEKIPMNEDEVLHHFVSEEKSTSNDNQGGKESKLLMDSHKEEHVHTGLEEKAKEEEMEASSQNPLMLPEKVALKSPVLHKCPHTKKIRGRRRSANCNCHHSKSTASEQQLGIDSQAGQSETKVQTETKTMLSEPELINHKAVVMEEENVPLLDISVTENVKCSLPTPTKSQTPSESPVEKHSVTVPLSSEVKGDVNQAEENSKDSGEVMHDGEEQDISSLQNGSASVTLQSPAGTSQSQCQAVEDEQEQSQSTGGHKVDNSDVAKGAKVEMPEKDPVSNELDSVAHPPCEEPVPLQGAPAEACLDSPPKQMTSDAQCGNSEVRESPSNSVTRGVWSPSASPSTSILKKGQKRQFEDDTPSPLIKSRRVSFANPIYQQELADDIDRRSPVIRTSSPKSKATGQPKYVTTPTKGLLTLSPRNLRSPGHRSSKKCLISEMSQEPRPIPKDCVYPALVACSTPVEAVLPQISSTMWPRGFGQLVRARNIKTVGDLSALTATEIKVLPIRSPKVSNLRKALKTYHEQQRKGRSDDLKSFDEMEKITSEPEEMAAPPNEEEDQTAGDGQGADPSDVASALEQKQEAAQSVEQKPEVVTSVDLLSDVAALGTRLNTEELGHCSPKELGQMHEHLCGMMRTIVDHLQSRLVTDLNDSLS